MNRKGLKKIYMDSLEDWPVVTKKSEKRYKKMRDAFDRYMGDVEEQAFIYGFQYALKMIGQSG